MISFLWCLACVSVFSLQHVIFLNVLGNSWLKFDSYLIRTDQRARRRKVAGIIKPFPVFIDPHFICWWPHIKVCLSEIRFLLSWIYLNHNDTYLSYWCRTMLLPLLYVYMYMYSISIYYYTNHKLMRLMTDIGQFRNTGLTQAVLCCSNISSIKVKAWMLLDVHSTLEMVWPWNTACTECDRRMLADPLRREHFALTLEELDTTVFSL